MLDLDAIDLDLLCSALQDHSPEARWGLDPATGEVVYRSDYVDDPLDDAEAERLVPIEPVGSRVAYRDMEDFIATVADERTAGRLDRAIRGQGAFRRFKDELAEHPEVRERWYAFSDARMRRRALRWLVDAGLVRADVVEAAIADHPDPPEATAVTVLDLSPDELLSTTRAVRRRLDLARPVDPAVVEACLDLALQAPTGGNVQRARFVVVTRPDVKAALAELYRRSYAAYRVSPRYPTATPIDDPDRAAVQQRVAASADHLAEHLHEVPVLLVPCVDGRPPEGASFALAGFYGSVLPAVWSFALAARARGLGTCWTTLHLPYEEEAADVLGIPYAEVTQVALLPVAHVLGEGFGRARREPLERVVSWERWGVAARPRRPDAGPAALR